MSQNHERELKNLKRERKRERGKKKVIVLFNQKKKKKKVTLLFSLFLAIRFGVLNPN